MTDLFADLAVSRVAPTEMADPQLLETIRQAYDPRVHCFGCFEEYCDVKFWTTLPNGTRGYFCKTCNELGRTGINGLGS